MISRKSAKLIADIYFIHFTLPTTPSITNPAKSVVKKDELYNYLYERDYEAEFINIVERSVVQQTRLNDFIKRIHTGESLNTITINWSAEDKFELGQKLLRQLATDILCEYENKTPPLVPHANTVFSNPPETQSFINRVNELIERPFKVLETLKKQLELDGYIYRDGVLYFSESSVIQEQEEQSILELLINKLPISNKLVIINHLKLSEEHYLTGKWGDAISNSRNFLEEVLQQIAQSIHTKENLTIKVPDRPFSVRDFLEQQNFIDATEKEAISKVYGLISNTGSHPNIAEQDQARLMRHLALTFSQFMLLRFEGYLKNNP